MQERDDRQVDEGELPSRRTPNVYDLQAEMLASRARNSERQSFRRLIFAGTMLIAIILICVGFLFLGPSQLSVITSVVSIVPAIASFWIAQRGLSEARSDTRAKLEVLSEWRANQPDGQKRP